MSELRKRFFQSAAGALLLALCLQALYAQTSTARPRAWADGSLTVQVESHGYLLGTVVRIGNSTLTAASASAAFDASSIRFVVPTILLATHEAFLNGVELSPGSASFSQSRTVQRTRKAAVAVAYVPLPKRLGSPFWTTVRGKLTNLIGAIRTAIPLFSL